MPIRTIKPEFWTDEKIVELSPWARLLFVGLWNFVDNEGRLPYSPKSIKMKIFPADDIEITPILTELQREKLVTVYTTDNSMYLQVNNWHKHQKVDPRYHSKIPPPPGGHTESHQTPPNPPLGNGNGNGNGKGGHPSRVGSGAFRPPSAAEVREYCLERNNGINPEEFINHYEANGWMRGKTKIKDWKACVRTWENKRKPDDMTSGAML